MDLRRSLNPSIPQVDKKCIMEESELPTTSTKMKVKRIFKVRTINLQVITNTGKLKQAIDDMKERNIRK